MELSFFMKGISNVENTKIAEKYSLEKQHIKGKLHAIERIKLLLDDNSFCEIGSSITSKRECSNSTEKLPYDGVITGYGTIAGHTVYVYSQDFTVNGGTLGLKHGRKIRNIIEHAITQRCPLIGINDSGGARIQEGVNALAGYGEVFYENTKASGYIPQITIIAGPCAGGAVYSPGITDFIFVVDKISQMFVTGPDVVASVTGQKCTAEELGGASIHATKSGVAHFRAKDEHECFHSVRNLVKMLVETLENKDCLPQYIKKNMHLHNIVPKESRKVYDIKKIIVEVFDTDSFLEVQKDFAPNLVVGFAKLSSIVVGIVANQPAYLGGILDTDSSDKGARFIRYCDAYDIPLITLVDVPGFMPGIQQEYAGIIRHGAKLLYAYSEATTIKITTIIRKAYGGAYIAMCSKHLNADFVYAWKEAEVAVMGGEGAIKILHKKELALLEGDEKKQFFDREVKEYETNYMNVNAALEEGYIDEIIEPSEMRKRFFTDILALSNKKKNRCLISKKHGCIPL